MLSGLRFAKGSAASEKEVTGKTKKKERRKEQKKRQKDKKNKKKASARSTSSSPDGSVEANAPEVAKIQTEVQEAPAGRQDGEDFFSSLGSVRERTKKDKPDPDKQVVCSRELNPDLTGRVSEWTKPATVSEVPASLRVGDGGAAWRRRAQLRMKQQAATDAGQEADSIREECNDFKLGRCKRGDACRFAHVAPAAEASKASGSGARDRSPQESRRRSRSPRRRSRSPRRGSRSRSRSFAAARAAVLPRRQASWRSSTKASDEEPTAEGPEAVLRRMASKYGSAEEPAPSPEVAPAAEEPEDANALGAMAMEAMLSGDMARYEELNKRLELRQAQLAAGQSSASGVQDGRGSSSREMLDADGRRTEVLEEVDAAGRSKVLLSSVQAASVATKGKHRGSAKVAAAAKGGRVAGFYGDDDVSLDELVRRERIEGVQDYSANLAEYISKKKGFKPLHEDEDEAYALGWYEDSSKKLDAKARDVKEQRQAVQDKQRVKHNLEKCTRCMESKRFARQAVISVSPRAFLCMDGLGQSILPGQLVICPQDHVPATTDVDDSTWTEMRNYQKCIVRYFEAQDPPQAVIFAESSIHRVSRDQLLLGGGPHAAVVAYPVPHETLSDARFFFKKAFDEAECEWSAQHKKVIETSAKGGVRGAIPKNFPYVHIDFSLGGGFAHVVEDSTEFAKDFVQHTIAGMCELTTIDRAYPTKDKHREAVEEMVRKFSDGFDWTQALKS